MFKNLDTIHKRGTKRLLDILLVVTSSVLFLPLIGLISLLIKIDSKGPVFYCHKRIGKEGREFGMWKFRTMVPNADKLLNDYFAQQPHLCEEWRLGQKLKNDPRVTRLGRYLRKISVDEIPQIWNVIRGEMSLVGPRPIVADEITRYEEKYQFYIKVKPGITGLWQVTGRSNSVYSERVFWDTYYVSNWSIWLDVYILLKTLWVVINRFGSY